MKKTLLMALILFSVFLADAQEVETFEVDSITNQISKSLPFDKSFILKIRTDIRPPYVEFLQNQGNKSWVETIKAKLKKNFNFEIPTIPVENIDFREEGGKKYLFITFGRHATKYTVVEIPPRKDGINSKLVASKDTNDLLRPARKYTIILPKPYDEATLIFNQLHQDPTDNGGLAKKLRDALYVRTQSVVGLGYHVQDIDKAKQFYTDSLKKLYTANDQIVLSADKYNIVKLKASNVTDQAIKSLLDQKNIEVLSTYYDLKALLPVLQNLTKLSDAQQADLLSGSISILNIEPEKRRQRVKQSWKT